MSLVPESYSRCLAALKARVRTVQVRAAVAANRELMVLYWDIGRAIVEMQKHRGWGAAVVPRLAQDLHAAFPDMKGFSTTNLNSMRKFFVAYRKAIFPQAVGKLAPKAISQQPVGKLPPEVVLRLPWGHNQELLFKLEDLESRLWYAEHAAANGWSRSMLVHQIASGLRGRQGQAANNFGATLPPPQSDLARQVVKDPYTFDFLALSAQAKERDLEQGLLDNLQKLLLELGVGFAFVGRQVPLEVAGEDYHLDLLFYHLKLRCFVVVELKAGPFKPEHAGKMSFYLSAIDAQLRHPDDQPSIGLILCGSRKKLIVEYALRDLAKPIGVAGYTVCRVLPPALSGRLPDETQLRARLKERRS